MKPENKMLKKNQYFESVKSKNIIHSLIYKFYKYLKTIDNENLNQSAIIELNKRIREIKARLRGIQLYKIDSEDIF